MVFGIGEKIMRWALLICMLSYLRMYVPRRTRSTLWLAMDGFNAVSLRPLFKSSIDGCLRI